MDGPPTVRAGLDSRAYCGTEQPTEYAARDCTACCIGSAENVAASVPTGDIVRSGSTNPSSEQESPGPKASSTIHLKFNDRRMRHFDGRGVRRRPKYERVCSE